MYALPLLGPAVFLSILSALKLADLVTTRAALKISGTERIKVASDTDKLEVFTGSDTMRGLDNLERERLLRIGI